MRQHGDILQHRGQPLDAETKRAIAEQERGPLDQRVQEPRRHRTKDPKPETKQEDDGSKRQRGAGKQAALAAADGSLVAAVASMAKHTINNEAVAKTRKSIMDGKNVARAKSILEGLPKEIRATMTFGKADLPGHGFSRRRMHPEAWLRLTDDQRAAIYALEGLAAGRTSSDPFGSKARHQERGPRKQANSASTASAAGERVRFNADGDVVRGAPVELYEIADGEVVLQRPLGVASQALGPHQVPTSSPSAAPSAGPEQRRSTGQANTAAEAADVHVDNLGADLEATEDCTQLVSGDFQKLLEQLEVPDNGSSVGGSDSELEDAA